MRKAKTARGTTIPAVRPVRLDRLVGVLVYASGALALLLTVLTGGFLVWALAGAGKNYVFAVDAAVEWLEVEEITHPVVSRIVLVSAAGGDRAQPLTGTLLPEERARVTLERRGAGPARVTLQAAGRSAGQLEWRDADGEMQSGDLAQEAAFRVAIAQAEPANATSCVKPAAGTGCLPPGTVRAVLQGPLNLGEESPLAAVGPRGLAAGPASPQAISVRMFGRSALIPSGVLYELGGFTLPPDARLKPVAGEGSLWATSVVPAEGGGFLVQATTTARELRVFSAAGPTHGDSISAGFFAVLFNDPDIASLAAAAAGLGALSQLLELLRSRLEQRQARRGRE
jgi:hypothetical protein